jgi:hypothetical protein
VNLALRTYGGVNSYTLSSGTWGTSSGTLCTSPWCLNSSRLWPDHRAVTLEHHRATGVLRCKNGEMGMWRASLLKLNDIDHQRAVWDNHLGNPFSSRRSTGSTYHLVQSSHCAPCAPKPAPSTCAESSRAHCGHLGSLCSPSHSSAAATWHEIILLRYPDNPPLTVPRRACDVVTPLSPATFGSLRAKVMQVSPESITQIVKVCFMCCI